MQPLVFVGVCGMILLVDLSVAAASLTVPSKNSVLIEQVEFERLSR